MTRPADDCESELALHGLTPVGRLESSNAPLLLRVRDDTGHALIVKRPESYWVAHEAEALELLAAAGVAPATRRIGDGLLLLEDLGDASLARGDDPGVLRAVGELALVVHAVAAQGWCTPVQEMWRRWSEDDERHPRFSSLPTAQAQGGQRILTELASWPNDARFLHGDFIPDNVLISAAGLRTIDPYGMIGDRAYDLASFACRCADPPRAMDSLLDGYGGEPPRSGEWLEFCCLYNAFQAPFWDEPAAPGLRRFLDLPDDWHR